MATTHFSLATDWHFDAPVERVWMLILRSEEWPDWWRAVKCVEPIRHGDHEGVGVVRRFTWTTALPYTLTFDVETVRVKRNREIEGRASGELDGVGLWTFSETNGGTHLNYLWRVEATKPWMRRLAPVLRPLFAWNHGKVMAWGLEGAKRRLAAAS